MAEKWHTLATFNSIEEMQAYADSTDVPIGTPVRAIMTFSTPVAMLFDIAGAELLAQQAVGSHLTVIDVHSPSSSVGVIECEVAGTPIALIAGGMALGAMAIAGAVLVFMIVCKLEAWMEAAPDVFKWGAIFVGVIGVTVLGSMYLRNQPRPAKKGGG